MLDIKLKGNKSLEIQETKTRVFFCYKKMIWYGQNIVGQAVHSRLFVRKSEKMMILFMLDFVENAGNEATKKW